MEVIYILLAIIMVALFALWIAIMKTNENVQLLGFQMINNEKSIPAQKICEEDDEFHRALAIGIDNALTSYLGKALQTNKKPYTTINGYPIYGRWKAWGKDNRMYVWEIWPKKWEDRDQWRSYGVGTVKPMVPPSSVVEEVLDELERLENIT